MIAQKSEMTNRYPRAGGRDGFLLGTDEARDDQYRRQSPLLGQAERWDEQGQSDDERGQQHAQRDTIGRPRRNSRRGSERYGITSSVSASSLLFC